MSYDLFFCRDKGPVPTFEEVAAWALQRPHFANSGSKQVWYENSDTGVYFSIEEDTEIEEDYFPDLCADSRLVFNLNFYRPTFFGHEALPFAVQLAKDFSMKVIDDDEVLKEPTVDELMESWQHGNRFSVEELKKELEPKPMMATAKAMRWWEYMYGKKSLQDRLGDELFVPRIFVVTQDSKTAETCMVWTPGIAMVVPPTDWVAFSRKKRLFGGKEETVYVRRGVVDAMVTVEKFEDSRDIKLLTQQNVKAADAAWARFDFGASPKMTGIGPDYFVDG